MNLRIGLRGILLAVFLIAVGCSDEASSPLDTQPQLDAVGSDATEFSGRATVVDASVPVVGVEAKISDTGPLPPSGGARSATLLTVDVPDILTARVAHASTVGQGDGSHSEAAVADLDLTVEGNRITAEFLMSRAWAECTDGRPSTRGESAVARLTVNGQEVTVSGEANQTVSLPVGRVVINEQSGSDGEITVNALHVIIPGVADVVVSSAHADIRCGQCPPPAGDFVTGGGWIIGPSGKKANFAVAGGIKNGDFWGHLTYIDHGARLKVKGTGVTAYEVTGENSRHIEGTARVDGQAVTYEVDVTDAGEPGRADEFTLRLSNGYQASGSLDGGNIQLHERPGGDCD